MVVGKVSVLHNMGSIRLLTTEQLLPPEQMIQGEKGSNCDENSVFSYLTNDIPSLLPILLITDKPSYNAEHFFKSFYCGIPISVSPLFCGRQIIKCLLRSAVLAWLETTIEHDVYHQILGLRLISWETFGVLKKDMK